MFKSSKKEEKPISHEYFKRECGNDMFRNVVRVQKAYPPFTDWVDWFFECVECGAIYNRHYKKIK